MSVCTCTLYIYIYMYIYIYVYICMYIYIYIYVMRIQPLDPFSKHIAQVDPQSRETAFKDRNPVLVLLVKQSSLLWALIHENRFHEINGHASKLRTPVRMFSQASAVSHTAF